MAAIGSQPSWTKDAVHTVRRFGEDAEIGDYIWTRDLHGRFRLGRITGPYRYENTSRNLLDQWWCGAMRTHAG